MTNDTSMTEEGFIVRALALSSSSIEARQVCKQELFNGSPDQPINPVAKAYTLTSMDTYQIKCDGVNLVGPTTKASNATTRGELRDAIAEAITILRNNGRY